MAFLVVWVPGWLRSSLQTSMLESSGYNAHTLERVVALGQKRSSSGLTVVLTALEVYGLSERLADPLGSPLRHMKIRYLISKNAGDRGDPEPGFVPLELVAVAEDHMGGSYETFRGPAITTALGDAEGVLEVTIRAAAKELAVTVTEVIGLVVEGSRRRDEGDRPQRGEASAGQLPQPERRRQEGQWLFRFSLRT